ncbi:hypothetical protein ABW20_dc0102495 [Dactylellina cionopaga]|nr:hypothetical protein ABW20_dc0102495 [Dactylellina cionopaga]
MRIGKADSATESPFDTARREASEEIGLPSRADLLPLPFAVTHLCEMPMNLSRNQLGVRPCVALLHTKPGFSGATNPEESLIPRLDPKEVASVFTVPLKAFLTSQYKNPDLVAGPQDTIPESTVDIDFGTVPTGNTGWYEGQWLEWYGVRWRGHQFNVYTPPVVVQRRDSTEVLEDEAQEHATGSLKGRTNGGGTHDKKIVKYKVWGMTARIVVDAARVAFGQNPDFEFVDKMGDDDVIAHLFKEGKLGPRVSGAIEDNGRGGEIGKVDTRKVESGKL